MIHICSLCPVIEMLLISAGTVIRLVLVVQNQLFHGIFLLSFDAFQLQDKEWFHDLDVFPPADE